MAMVTCKNCGHKMSDNWANMVNQCPNCKKEIYTNKNKSIAVGEIRDKDTIIKLMEKWGGNELPGGTARTN